MSESTDKKVVVDAVPVDTEDGYAEPVTTKRHVNEREEHSEDETDVSDTEGIPVEEENPSLEPPGNYPMYNIDEDGEYLDMTNQRLTELDDLSEYKNIVELVLRLNRLGNDCFEKFNMLTQLKRIDLYENHLTPIHGNPFSELKELEELDLCFNEIRYPRGFEGLKLRELYLSQNKIAKLLPGLNVLADTLQMLELGSNRIRVIENFEKCIHLTRLYLGKNKITKIDNLSTLTNLRILSLQANRITKIENLDALVNLEELYLSENGIEKMENLDKLVNLRILDVGRNKLTRIEGIEALENLVELWADYNKVNSFDFLPVLAAKKDFKVLYFEHNPIAFEHNYQTIVRTAIPNLEQLDSQFFNDV